MLNWYPEDMLENLLMIWEIGGDWHVIFHTEQSWVFQSAWILSLGVRPGSVVHSESVFKKVWY